MGRSAHLLFAAALATAALAATAPGTRADTCVDLRSGQNYDCSGDPPPPPKKAAPPLKTILRRALTTGAESGTSDAATAARQQRIADAASAALTACNSGDMSAYDAKVNAAAGAAVTSGEQQLIANVRATCNRLVAERETKQAKAQKPAPAQAAAAPAAKKEPYSVCGPADRYGVRTCFELMRTGEGCNKTLQQNGDTIWQVEQLPACPEDILARRDAYFAGSAPPAGKPEIASPDADVVAALRQMPAECMDRLRAFLQTAREGGQSDAASTQAMREFSDLERQCALPMQRLVDALGLAMPTRKMAAADRSRMSRALEGGSIAAAPPPPDQPSPGTTAGDDGGEDGGSYDIGEVVGFGIQALGILSDVLGAFASGYAGGPAIVGGHTNTGAPGHIQRQNGPSTISGGHN
ncbi:MAG TPA: hypothetical protein VMG55_22045 [Stellaceae bacterium]|nr:hypothetical protein [Stellaceae bacterium]